MLQQIEDAMPAPHVYGQLFQRHELVEREAKLAHMVEEARARLEFVHVRSLVERQTSRQEPGLLQIRYWLDARQCHEERGQIGILPRTCNWILERPETFQLVKMFPQALGYALSAMQISENREATTREARDLFFSLLDFLPSCFLTIDALDECQDRLDFSQIISRIPNRFKIMFTSRPLPELLNQLRQVAHSQVCLDISSEVSTDDIDEYIAHELVTWPHIHDGAMLMHIKERLPRSGGMFLWVRLMLQHIQDQTRDASILHCLDELPTSLSERYDSIIARINGLPKPQRLLAHKVFFKMDVARRPLEVKEVCALLAVRPSVRSGALPGTQGAAPPQANRPMLQPTTNFLA
ncbi:hypothetical protein B0H67DRAFT_641428 [Lasiosphaeris hirsuta]|uniref:Nephrocystin 3-like N-terminal domain-containing protein n=1 Tax=Lasiosphaeris hirsuta TaxID=260670 RepID=A0AA40AZS8_9PEZI|nr:hypothetical protein B0H67DRAFT_641428 [Lasiosphaeris hirsuta]